MERLIAELYAGRPVLLPTDTVYGLVSRPSEAAVAALYELKGRRVEQPTALLAASVEQLLETIPELDEVPLRKLLPGPFTLVLPNPERRYAWLAGENPGAIGVRVPKLPDTARQVVAAVGAVAATSANDPGGADPRVLADVPERIRNACAALDAGPLPGTPSTVLDLTGPEPRVLREAAIATKEALALLNRVAE
jgi:tRNA threonylcarbamoyl adenosine modification protein (Sua5/YciO/YrdC/YwlC family)